MRTDSHLYGFDLLRFSAACLVICDHFASYGKSAATSAASGSELAFPYLKRMDYAGSVGVEIFFLISGFVIAASAQNSTASGFLLKRCIRVLPALWISSLVALFARHLSGEPTGLLLQDYLRSALLSPVGPYMDGVVWTLVVEAVFYFVIFLLLTTWGFSKIEVLAKMLGAASCVFTIVMGAASALGRMFPLLAKLAAICGRYPFKLMLLRHGIFFALGMLLWAAFECGFTRRRQLWIGLTSFCCVVELGIDHGSAIDVVASISVWLTALLCLLVSVRYRQALQTMLVRRKKMVEALGRLSYPLYLNHYVLGMSITRVFFSWGLSSGAALVSGFACVGAVSYVIMRYPERWVQMALRGRYSIAPSLAHGRAP